MHALFDDAGKLHDAVVPLLPQEEQERQKLWFSSVRRHVNEFVDEVEKWLFDAKVRLTRSKTHKNIDSSVFPQVPLPVDEPPDAQNIDCHPIFDHAEGGAGIVEGDEIKPSDSVSNAPSKTAGSSKGNESTVSSTVSVRIKAEADMAAHIARQKWLKDKHALEEQEEQLRKRKEQLDLEMEMHQ